MHLPRVEAFSNGPGVIVFHAAAVADYAPVRTDGKISSDQEELTITLRRNPKIVDQIKPLGRNNVTLCSFKLLSRKDARDVRDVARVQLIRTGSDLVVANYVEDVFAGQYLGWICLPNGEDIVVSSRAELARRALGDRPASPSADAAPPHSTIASSMTAARISDRLTHRAPGRATAAEPREFGQDSFGSVLRVPSSVAARWAGKNHSRAHVGQRLAKARDNGMRMINPTIATTITMTTTLGSLKL